MPCCNGMESESRPMSMVLTSKGQSSYVISLRGNAQPPEQFAAEELRRYLRQIGGADLPIETDSRRKRAIVLTATLSAKTPDAFSIRTIGEKLVLAGASPRAVL